MSFGDHSVDDVKGYERLLVGVIIVIGGLIWASFYYWQNAANDVQRAVNKAAAQRAAHRMEGGLDRLVELPPEVEAQLKGQGLPLPEGQAPLAATQEEAVAESDATKTEDAPPSFLQRIKAVFFPPPPRDVTPAEVPVKESPAVFDRPFTAGRDEDAIDSTQLREVVWKRAPRGISVAAGDVIHLSAPGLHIGNVELTGVLESAKGFDWLLKASGPDADALERVIKKRPKGLKIHVDNS